MTEIVPEKPIRVSSFNLGGQSFGNLTEAADYLMYRQSEHWDVNLPLEMEAAAELFTPETANAVEQLRIMIPGRTAIVPRRTVNNDVGVAVSTAPFPKLDVITHVDDYYSSPLLDRGIAWLQIAPQISQVRFKLGVKREHGFSGELIEENIREAGKKALTLVMSVLAGDADLPYAN